MRRFIWSTILFLLAVSAFWAVREYNRVRADSATLAPKFYTSATALLKEFVENDSTALEKYKGANLIIAVTGAAKEIIRDENGRYTILLGDTASLSSVRCSIDTAYSKQAESVVTGSIIRIKGNFNGYKPDEMGIGADIEFNFCVVDSPFLKKNKQP